MYHYVREKNGWNGIAPILPKEFEHQIEIIARTYDIVSVDELKTPSAKPRCVLTFDDGTKDQYQVAYQILKKKGLPGYFTVMSGPAVTGKMAVFHLVHTVLSLISDLEIWQLLKDTYDTGEVHDKSSIYHYEPDLYRRYNKYVLNFLMSSEESRQFLENILTGLSIDTLELINNFYLSKEEIREMADNGMTIGVHCHQHTPYNGDSFAFFDEEIAPCIRYLKDQAGILPRWYTPSYGGGNNSNIMKEQLEPLLKANGFQGGFTTQPGLNHESDEFWRKRIDCINLPPRKYTTIEEALSRYWN